MIWVEVRSVVVAVGRGREEEAAYCKYQVPRVLGFRKLLRLLSGTNKTILDVL